MNNNDKEEINDSSGLESRNMVIDSSQHANNLKNKLKPRNMFIIFLQTMLLKVFPLAAMLGYSHFHSSDTLMSMGFIVSAYILIILEFQEDKTDISDVKSQRDLSVPLKNLSRNQNEHMSEISQNSISHINSENPKYSNPIINLEQPLLDSKELQKKVFRYKKLIYCILCIFTTLEFALKIGFMMIVLLNENLLKDWLLQHASMMRFFSIDFQRADITDVSIAMGSFVPDIFMLMIVIVMMLFYFKNKKIDSNDVFHKNSWKNRLEVLIVFGLLMTPFLSFSLLGIPYIFFLLSFLISIIRKAFTKAIISLLKVYIILFLFCNHLANIPLLFNIPCFDSIKTSRTYIGIDLYADFPQDFYKFALNITLVALLMVICVYTSMTENYHIEPNLANQVLLPISSTFIKNYHGSITLSSQDDKEDIEDDKSLKTKILKYFQKPYDMIINFFQSLETILRALQVYSIVIIMRYENIYPLGSLLWMFISGLSVNHSLLAKISGVCVIPLTFIQILILYYFNIPKNIEKPEKKNDNLFGFDNYSWEGFEYLFLTLYLIIQIIYVSQVIKFLSLPKRISNKKDASSLFRPSSTYSNAHITFVIIFRTLLYKNSYFLTLFILFWISLYTVNLIHLILALFFVIFFLKTGTNSLIIKSSDLYKSNNNNSNNNNISNQHKKYVITFQQKYWIYLVIYVDFIILIRHIWNLFIIRYYTSLLNNQYIDFVGVNYNYGITSLNYGLRDVDFASNTINWTLFVFVVMQHDMYKSKTFKFAPNMMILLKDYEPIQGKIYKILDSLVRWVYIIYFKSIIWVGYLVMMTLLIYEPIDMINSLLLMILLIGFVWHLFRIKAKNANICAIYRFWLCLTLLITTVNVLRYVFQFFRFQLFQTAFDKTHIYDFLNDYGHEIGLFFYEPFCKETDNCEIFPNKLRFGFLFNIILLFFAVLGYNYLAMIQLNERYLAYKRSVELNEESIRDLEANERKWSLESEGREPIGFGDYLKNINQFLDDYVNVSLRKEIKGLEALLYYICLFYISIMFFFIMLFCVYFWLSIANFIYLLLYLFYFYKVHGSYLEFTFESNLYHRINEKMLVFKRNFLSYQALTDTNFIPEHDYNRKTFLNDLNIIKMQCLTAKVEYKKVLWKIVVILTAICLLLTFLSQWCVIYQKYRSKTDVEYIMWGLFLFGTYNCDGNALFKDIYPYYMLMILNFIELKSILYMEETLAEQIKSLNLTSMKTKDHIILPIKPIKEFSFNCKNDQIDKEIQNAQTMTYKCHNFFKNHARSLKHDFIIAVLYALERIYLIVFLINSAINYSFFSMITFLTVVYLSLRSNSPTNVIKILNGCSLVLLMIRYPLFLMNINENTSPRVIPADLQRLMNFDLADCLFKNSGLSESLLNYVKQYLALGEIYYDYVSFFVNSIILFTVQFYFIIMFYLIRLIYECIEKRSTQIEDQQWNMMGEYKKWIGTGLKCLTVTHSFLIANMHIMICFLIAFFLIFNYSVYNIVLFAFIMGFLLINENFLSEMSFIKKQKTLKTILNIILIYQVILLFITQIIHFPVIMSKCIENMHCSHLFETSNWDKLTGLIFVKFALDALNNQNFLNFCEKYMTRQRLRAKLLKTCLTYEVNDAKLQKWLEKLENKLILKEKVRFVVQKLEHWHAKYFSTEQKLKQVTEKVPHEPLHVISSEKKLPEVMKMTHEEISLPKEKISLRMKILSFLQSKKDKYLFSNSLNLFKFVLEKNCNIVGNQTIALTDYMFNKFEKLERTLNYLEHLQAKLLKMLKHKLRNPDVLQELNSSETYFEKFFLNLYDDIQESLKSELPTGGYIQKDYGNGKLMIQQPNNEGFLDLKEFDYESMKPGDKPSIFLILMNILQVLLSHWDIICYIFIICYFYWNTGLICVLLPGFFFGFLMIEEKNAKTISWGFLMLFFLTIALFKMIFSIKGNENSENSVHLIFGENFAFYYEFFLIIIISIQINLLKMKGLDKYVISENENIYQTFLRKKLNNDFEDIKKNNEIIQELNDQQDEFDSLIETQKVKEESPKNREPSFDEGGFYLHVLNEKDGEPLLKRQISFYNRYDESSKQCNYDKLKLRAIKDLEREVISSILQMKLKQFKNQLFRFFSIHSRKIGKDFYSITLTIQIAIALYIFFLFSKMLDADNDTSIADSVKYSTFSGRMVLALFFHFAVMFFERLIMLYNPFKNEKPQEMKSSISMFSFDQQLKIQPILSQKSENMYKTPIFLKYLLHCSLLIVIPYFVLIFIPTHGTNKIKEELDLNKYALFFFLLYCLYFYVSALQIKHGFQDKNKLKSLQRGYSQFQGFMFQVYKVIPFLYEFKTFMDWYFTETSLSLVRWLKVEEITGKLFLAKCSSMKFKKRKYGSKVKWFIKFFMGGCGVFLLVLCIFGPMLLFSTLNPIAEQNLIQQISVKVGIMINDKSYFQLFEANNVRNIDFVSNSDYINEGFDNVPYLENVDRSEFQRILIQPYSDEQWSISHLKLEILKETIKAALNGTVQSDFDFLVDYSMKRQKENVWLEDSVKKSLNNNSILKTFLSTISECQENQMIYLPNYFTNTLKISANSEISVVQNINLVRDLYLSLKCNSQDNTSYWQLSQDKNFTKGIACYTISSHSTSDLLGYSIIGFYIGVVYLIGKLLRTAISGKAVSFLFTDLPDPDSLIRLIESIKIARQEKNLYMEEMFYYELMDLLKSPDVVKQITGSSVQYIKDKEKRK